MNPTISIIVPIYKVELYLRKCIESLVAQTFTNIEIILVDDGSPDHCGEICDEYAAKDDRVKVVHKQNGGVSSARNTGLDVAQGKYIGFVDGDDWVEKDMYTTLYNGIVAYKADIAQCTHRNIKVDASIKCSEPDQSNCDGGTSVYTCEQALLELLNNTKITNLSGDKLYKAHLFLGLRYPQGQTYEDWYTVPRLIARTQRVVKIRQVKYYYVRHADGITGSLDMHKRYDFFCAVKERVCFIKEVCPQLLSYYVNDFIQISLMLFYDIKQENEGDNKVYLLEMRKYIVKHFWAGMLHKDLPLNCKVYLLLLCINGNFYTRCKTVFRKLLWGPRKMSLLFHGENKRCL